jgi:hypothetical protein
MSKEEHAISLNVRVPLLNCRKSQARAEASACTIGTVQRTLATTYTTIALPRAIKTAVRILAAYPEIAACFCKISNPTNVVYNTSSVIY